MSLSSGKLKFTIPSPFNLALLITLVVIIITYFSRSNDDGIRYLVNISGYWQQGVWELLAFTMQMVLILILGHSIALTKFFDRVVSALTQFGTSSARAAVITCLFSLITCLLNWGLGLVLSAILARKMAEKAAINNRKLNYPLVGAAAYSGMMIWHAGFSGSATLTVASENHFLFAETGAIPVHLTIFSTLNIIVIATSLLVLPAIFYLWGRAKTSVQTDISNMVQTQWSDPNDDEKVSLIGKLVGSIILIVAIGHLNFGNSNPLKGLNLNSVNLILFGLGILMHKSITGFVSSIKKIIQGASDIVIQFPLYAGIIGIIKYSGVFEDFATALSNLSSLTAFPITTFLSAGVLNFFVPSGGGQWAVQGPIIIQTASEIGYSHSKAILAFAYGDQLTNMIQPFWALPLLGITGLSPLQILKYSAKVMTVGAIIFTLALLII